MSEYYPVIALAETWLDGDINDCELFSNKYVVYRTDRNERNSSKKRGGGVLIAVRSDIKSRLLNIAAPELEEVWVTIQFGKINYCLGTVYIQPSMDSSVYAAHLETVERACNHCDKIMVLGDFNLPQIQWSIAEDYIGLLPGNVKSDSEIILCDNMAFYGMSQFNMVGNSNGNILDLCFCNFAVNSVTSSVGLVNCDPYHPPLEICMTIEKGKYLDNNTVWYFDFKNILILRMLTLLA